MGYKRVSRRFNIPVNTVQEAETASPHLNTMEKNEINNEMNQKANDLITF